MSAKNMCSGMQIKTEKDDNLRDEKADIKHMISINRDPNENIQIEEIGADTNNNDDDDDNNDNNTEVDDDESQLSFDSSCALDLSVVSSHPLPPPGHVALETLQNTKVAVAQFATTAIANSKNYDEAIKDLAVVQSTFFNLHHQQMLQMQLIHELQSRLLVNQKDVMRDDDEKNSFFDKVEHEKNKKVLEEEEKSVTQSDQKTSNYDSFMENKLEATSLNITCEKNDENVIIEKETKKDDVLRSKQKENKENEKTSNYDVNIQKSNEYLSQPQLCHISSSLASSIITNHDPLPSPNEPNSLEMLQKRTQEVLDSASQGILATNLADEIALRKDNTSQDGKGKNEPFFKHRCKYCGKVFGSDSALQIHIRSHTGERPFQCDVCASKFTTKGNLKVHYQRHTQRYPCGPIMGLGSECLDNYGFPPPLQMRPDQPTTIYPQPMNERLVGFQPPVYNAFENFLHVRPSIDVPKHQNLNRNFESEEIIDKEQDTPTDLSKPSKDADAELNTCNTNCNNSTLGEELKQDTQIFPVQIIPVNQNIPASKLMANNSLNSSVKDSQDSAENLSKEQPRSLSSSSSDNSSVSEVNSDLPSLSNIASNPIQNDHSWENLIEIAKPSETSKLQQLVDNIENKLADPNQCVFCQKILSCRSALQMHYRTHTGERPYRCRICGRAFATKGNLKAHMIIHKIKPPIRSQFKCPVCHNKFSNSLTLQEHIKTHTKDALENYHNKMHERDANDKNNFQQNMGFESTISESSEQRSDLSQDDYDDDYIMEIDDDDEFSENDMRMESNVCLSQNSLNDGAYESKNSSTSLSSADVVGALDLTPKTKNIASNYENNSLNAAQSQNISRFQPFLPFPSGTLGNSPIHVFSSPFNSLTHSAVPPLPFHPFGLTGIRGTTTCKVCYKTFACSSALEIHFRSHTKERPFKCSSCDRAFSTKGNLKQHFLTHKHCDASIHSSSTSSHSEDESSYTAPQKLHSSDHEHSTTIKQFEDEHINSSLPASPIDLVQEECNQKDEGRRQKLKQDLSDMRHPFLKRHIGVTDSDAFDSTITNSSSQSRSLNETENSTFFQSYMKENSEYVNYSPTDSELDQSINIKHYCTVCRKNFSSTSALQIHMRTHTGDKPFRCTVCQKAFTTKGNLKVHMSTHMWTNSASRRGRRMSLEFPIGRPPIGSHPGENEYLSRRTDIFYSYIPPALNGMQYKLGELRPIQPGSYSSFAPISPSNIPTKYTGLLGFNPFMSNSPSGLHQFQLSSSVDTRSQETLVNTTVNSFKEDSKLTGLKSTFWNSNLTESKTFEGKDVSVNQGTGNINLLHSDNRTESVKV